MFKKKKIKERWVILSKVRKGKEKLKISQQCGKYCTDFQWKPGFSMPDDASLLGVEFIWNSALK